MANALSATDYHAYCRGFPQALKIFEPLEPTLWFLVIAACIYAALCMFLGR
jgi:hypothetical protein